MRKYDKIRCEMSMKKLGSYFFNKYISTQRLTVLIKDVIFLVEQMKQEVLYEY